MKLNPKTFLLTAVAIASGLVVLLGYFIPVLAGLSARLLEWAVILTAVLLLVGVINLFRIHWDKIKRDQKNRGYSLVLVISLLVTLLITAPFGPTSTWSLWLYNYILIPMESSLMGVLAIVLIYACARMFNQRLSVFTLIFIGTVLLFLLGTVSLPGLGLVFLRDLKDWVSSVWSVAGGRGILLGVGLGTVATGLRILMGADRPYGG